jgi:copper oxidase (laccase) domain-containing protein
MKKTRTIQIRVSEEEKEMINALYENISDFKLSNFVRKRLRELYLEKGLNEKGIGILHGGWRGIAEGIVERGVEKLLDLTKCLPAEVFLKVGPSIGSCCFEVGEKSVECFEKYLKVIEIRGGKKYIDLRRVVRQIALRIGLLEDRIDVDCECTACLSKRYFSFRRDKPKKVQAMIAGIRIE